MLESLLGLSFLSTIGTISLISALTLPIIAAIIAHKKNRSGVSWFFLTLLIGIVAIIILACTDTLDRESGEKDQVARILWIVIAALILLSIIAIVLMLIFVGSNMNFTSEVITNC